MTLSSLVMLIGCNLIWAGNPAMSKVLMQVCTPIQVAWLRYVSAGLTMIVLMAVVKSFRPELAQVKESFRSKRDFLLLFAIGFLTFFASPLLQMKGLSLSRATDNAILIAIEPLVTVALAAVFLKERLSKNQILAFAVAISGFALLSGMGFGKTSDEPTVQGAIRSAALGNLLMFVSLVGEGAYSVCARPLLRTKSPHVIFSLSLAVGILLLSSVFIFGVDLPPVSTFNRDHWLAVAWLGPAGTAFGYLLWMVVMKRIEVSRMVLTLFVQPLVGTLIGFVFLGERLSGAQWMGGLLIIMSLAMDVFGPKPRTDEGLATR